ncbi:hypothetical protein BH24GEM3_BH24GEM3_21190 [soil metagenome]
MVGALPRRQRVSLLLLGNVAAVLAVTALDWMMPAGVVVGVLACVPILLTSMLDDVRDVWLVAGLAIVGFVLAAYLGHGPLSPAVVWVPNRILAFLSLPSSAVLAYLLQRRRLEVVTARDSAVAASELNRLLMSLLAHDLRSPLTISNQVVEYVEDALDSDRPIDRELLADVRARLRRSLRAIEIVLNLARTESQNGGAPAAATQVGVRVIEEVEAEIASFRQEAQARRKELLARLDEVRDGYYRVNGLVLRQALAILVDNAIRYALPGPIRISARASEGELTVRVEDTGPGLSTCRQSGSGGSGIGLELCRSLVRNAGGSLDLERDSPEGTSFVLRLPATPLSPA